MRCRSLLTAGTVVAVLACAAQGSVSAAPLTVSVTVSGPELLGAGALGDYDVTAGYDTARLLFQSLSFGDQLQLSDGSMRSEDSSVPGQVRASEVSLVDPLVLSGSQADAFALFSIVFDVVSGTPGEAFATVSIVNVLLGDAIGDPLPERLLQLSAKTDEDVPAVPEPATGMVAGAGLAVLLARRARRRACSAGRCS